MWTNEFISLFLLLCKFSPMHSLHYPHRNLLSKMLSIQPSFTFSEPTNLWSLLLRVKRGYQFTTDRPTSVFHFSHVSLAQSGHMYDLQHFFVIICLPSCRAPHNGLFAMNLSPVSSRFIAIHSCFLRHTALHTGVRWDPGNSSYPSWAVVHQREQLCQKSAHLHHLFRLRHVHFATDHPRDQVLG